MYNAPPVSVVMPVRNGERFLDAGVRSILDQTFQDFEFVILDDASTDGTPDMLADWARRDPRIRLARSNARLGCAGGGNRLVTEARAPLCARMDADDVSDPDRLRRQVSLLNSRPEVCLIGTLWDGIDAAGGPIRPVDRWRVLRRSPFAPFMHGSIAFRREAFWRAGGYREACEHWEDLDLYIRMSDLGPVVVLLDLLYHYRLHMEGSVLRSDQGELRKALDLMRRCLAARRARLGYDALLDRAGNLDDGALDPYYLYAMGARRLWAGLRPGIVGQIPRMRRWPLNLRAGAVLVLALWGEAHPRSLRAALRAHIRVLDALAGLRLPLGKGATAEWRFA
ncbi:MAG: glycosyltransferase family 2 protein [bacterium]|nr:glycosyltransferase family 2 protein [bacterium]